MLTIFSTPKPFAGQIEMIQRNAIESWKRLDANVEIVEGDVPPCTSGSITAAKRIRVTECRGILREGCKDRER